MVDCNSMEIRRNEHFCKRRFYVIFQEPIRLCSLPLWGVKKAVFFILYSLFFTSRRPRRHRLHPRQHYRRDGADRSAGNAARVRQLPHADLFHRANRGHAGFQQPDAQRHGGESQEQALQKG